MRCRATQELLPGYVEGSLRGEEEVRCSAHLATCPACRGVAADLGRLPAALSQWSVPAADLPSGQSIATQALQLERAQGTSVLARPRWRLAAAGAASLVAIALAGLVADRLGHPLRLPSLPDQPAVMAKSDRHPAAVATAGAAASGGGLVPRQVEIRALSSPRPSGRTTISDRRGEIDAGVGNSARVALSRSRRQPGGGTNLRDHRVADTAPSARRSRPLVAGPGEARTTVLIAVAPAPSLLIDDSADGRFVATGMRTDPDLVAESEGRAESDGP